MYIYSHYKMRLTSLRGDGYINIKHNYSYHVYIILIGVTKIVSYKYYLCK